MTKLVAFALFVLEHCGAGYQTPNDWEDDLCRCAHRRSGHVPACMKCRCGRFRLKARLR